MRAAGRLWQQHRCRGWFRLDRRESGSDDLLLPPPAFDALRMDGRCFEKGLDGAAPLRLDLPIQEALQLVVAGWRKKAAHAGQSAI